MTEQQVVRWGVIGAGGIADRKTIPGLLAAENCRLEAVMDVAGAEAVAQRYNVGKHGRDLDVVLCDEAVQAVYIATPVACHFEQIQRAAESGKHVLCEKPLTLSSDTTRVAAEICRNCGVLLQEGYMMKFHGAHRKIRDLIRAGRLGKLTCLRAQLSCWYPPIPGAWRQDPARGGGGALMDMATHLFDLLEFFSGPIVEVFAFTGSVVHAYASEDSSTTLLRFANGAQGMVDCFFNIPDGASRTRLEIYGSQGAILTEGTIGQGDGGRMEGYFERGSSAYDAGQNKDGDSGFAPIAFEKTNMYTAECRSFADCILKQRPVEVNGPENAVHIMDVTEKAYASARTGRSGIPDGTASARPGRSGT